MSNKKDLESNSMKSLAKISLRKAVLSDSEFLWHLRNQPDVYKYAKNNRPVEWKEHSDWFASVVAGTVAKELFIIEKSRKPIGQIRFDFLDGNETKISVSVLPESRGQGAATAALREAVRILKNTQKAGTVVADIHKDNIASQNLFKKLNFRPQGKDSLWLKFFLKEKNE